MGTEARDYLIMHSAGQSQQNAYIERYKLTVRHEWLDQHIINSIEEAQHFATQWLWTYNNDRPKMGGTTPAQKLKMAAYVLRPRPLQKRKEFRGNSNVARVCDIVYMKNHNGSSNSSSRVSVSVRSKLIAVRIS